KSESSFSQVIHSAGVRRFGEYRYLTPRGKGNQAPLVQLQQQRPCRHVLPQASPITPIPLLTQRLGQSPPAPVRMSRQQLADLLQVALRYLSALHQHSVVHRGSMPEGKSGVQRKVEVKRNRGKWFTPGTTGGGVSLLSHGSAGSVLRDANSGSDLPRLATRKCLSLNV